MRDSQSVRECLLLRRQDKTAPGSMALSFVNRIVKLPFTLILSPMFVSDTLDFSVFPSHDTLVVEEIATMLKLVIAIRRIRLIIDFMIFIYDYPQ